MMTKHLLLALSYAALLAAGFHRACADEIREPAIAGDARASLQDLGDVSLHYPGVRWTLLYGSYEGVEQFAVNEVQRMVQ